MAFVEMGSFHHYQPPNAGLHRDGRLKTSNLCLSSARGKGKNLTALEPSKKPSEFLQDDDCIEILDMAGPPPKESLNQSDVPASDLDDTQRNMEDTSNGVGSIDGHDRSSGEKDDSFSSFEKLLFKNEETQVCQRTHSSDEHMMGGSEDRSGAASIRSSEGEHQEGHVRSTYCRNRSAAYSPFASVLNSENVKSHAEDLSNAALSTDAGLVTDAGVTDTRDFFKRTADIAELNEGEEGEHRLKKIRREDQRADLSLRERV